MYANFVYEKNSTVTALHGLYAANTTTLTGFAFASNGTSTFGEVVYFDDVNFYDPAAGGGPSGVNEVQLLTFHTQPNARQH